MEIIKPSPLWEDKSHFKMIDVGPKGITCRKAQAQGEIRMSQEAFLALKNGKNPKGNVLALAEVAGIMSAKRTADLIPLCHPLPLDQVRFNFRLDQTKNTITVFCEVSTSAKTGVEMEALSGVNGALLSIYDLSKAVDPAITIQSIRLNVKEGGKTGTWVHPEFSSPAMETGNHSLQGVLSAVITVSDRVSGGIAQDQSGPEIVSFLEGASSLICGTAQIADNKLEIQATLRKFVEVQRAELIIVTGGTGLGPRDVTPEAVEELCDRLIPGLGECLRKEGAQHISTAWLSRSVGGIFGKSLIIALPGSPAAVREGLTTLTPLLPHALHIVRGGNHESKHER